MQVLPSEGELCERFGFSRIVIREAIKSLVAKGMLEVSRRVGTLALDPARWNLFDPDVIRWRAESMAFDPTMSRDLMELRRIVEPAAVRLAAARASAEERRALRTAYMAMERAVAGKGDYVEADLAFHTTILSACGNQFLRQMTGGAVGHARTSFEIVSQKPGGPGTRCRCTRPCAWPSSAATRRAPSARRSRLIEHAEEDLKELLPRARPRRRRLLRPRHAGAPRPALPERRDMKITSLATYRVAPRWMFLKIETDEGLSGWGEPVLEGRARTVEAAVRELGETLIGQDPLRINDHWQSMVPRPLLPRRRGADERHRRHRPGALGHPGQGARRAGARVAGRPRA